MNVKQYINDEIGSEYNFESVDIQVFDNDGKTSVLKLWADDDISSILEDDNINFTSLYFTSLVNENEFNCVVWSWFYKEVDGTIKNVTWEIDPHEPYYMCVDSAIDDYFNAFFEHGYDEDKRCHVQKFFERDHAKELISQDPSEELIKQHLKLDQDHIETWIHDNGRVVMEGMLQDNEFRPAQRNLIMFDDYFNNYPLLNQLKDEITECCGPKFDYDEFQDLVVKRIKNELKRIHYRNVDHEQVVNGPTQTELL